MRRLRALLAALAATALFVAATAARGAPPASQRLAEATLSSCHPAVAASERVAAFGAAMRAIGGSATMAIRLDLLERTPLAPVARVVSAPGLGVWRRSLPGVGVLRYSQAVSHLAAPADYWVAARFRWLDHRGRPIATTIRLSPTCRMPDPRPNLVAGPLRVRELASDARYRFGLSNRGHSPSGAFSVSFYLGTTPLATRRVASLDPGARRELSFTGPACGPGTTVRALIDPGAAVDEATKADNVAATRC